MELTGEAQGKLLLFGEHAVVYGHPALGFALPLATHVTLFDMARGGDPDSTALIECLVQHWDRSHRDAWRKSPWHVRIQSTVPIGCGFGSSAALTGALARAWGQTRPAPPDDAMLRLLAHQAEHEFHGHPSGVDTALALGHGLLAFTPQDEGPPHIRNVSSAPFCLVMGSVPRVSDAKTLIAGIHGQRDRRPEATQRRLARLGFIASQALWQLETSQPDCAANLGRLACNAQKILHDFGLSTPTLDSVLQSGRDAGACGGKLSGAGGGGAFVLFCRTSEDARRVHQAIVHLGPDVSANMQSYTWSGEALQPL